MKKGVRDILAILWRHRARAALGILCLLVVDGAQLAIPLVVRHVVDGLARGAATRGIILRGSFLLLLLALVIALFRFLWRHFFFSLARQAELDLRNRILDHALTLSTRFFQRTRTGEFLALASNDVESVRQALAMGFVAGFDASVYALVAIGAMLFLDPVLALWTILPLPFLAGLMAVSLKAIYDRWDAVQASFEALTEKTRESVAGMRVLRAYDRGHSDLADFERYNADVFAKTLKYVRVDAVFHPAVLLLAGSCVAILLAVGGGRVLSGNTSVGSFVAFASYLGMLTWPMIAAGWMLSLTQRAAASMDRINGLFAERDAEGSGRPVPSGEGRRGGLEARGLTFAFPGAGGPALRDVCFAVSPGGSLGLVGEVGSGKSTLAQLLLRLHEPPEGTLFLDGEDVAGLNPENLRRAIAYVPQEPFLFSDTIAENLRLGKEDATRGEMEESCRLSALHEEVAAFPDGYDTLLGERGITLSGGQKQRLCLARALLKPSSVLVLDDTLSAVDADTERRILAGMAEAVRDRTLVVVSHRMSAVRDLDLILVLREGRVVQVGRHDDLMDREGYYRDMVELQEMERE
ncbi:MAG: ABC transporter ATP-binding protein [Acidobacteriota bacterium]